MSNLTKAEINGFTKFINANLKHALPGELFSCQVDSIQTNSGINKINISFIDPPQTAQKNIATNNGQVAGRSTSEYIIFKRMKKHSPYNTDQEVRYDIVLKEELGHGIYGTVFPLLVTFIELESGKLCPKFSSRQRVVKRQEKFWEEESQLYAKEIEQDVKAIVEKSCMPVNIHHIEKQVREKYSLFMRKEWETDIKIESQLGGLIDQRFSTLMSSDSVSSSAYMIMTKAPGERVDKYIKDISEGRPVEFKKILSIMVAILRALQDIHQAGIVHLDIKPENIFYDEHLGIATIIDFGLSAVVGAQKAFCGTPVYAAPELVQYDLATEQLKDDKIECKAIQDIFSLAGVFLQLLGVARIGGYFVTPKDFFKARSIYFSYDTTGLFKGLADDIKIRSEIENVVNKMMHHNPEQRSTTDETLKSLESIQLEIDSQKFLQHQHNFSQRQLRENFAKLSAAIQNAKLILQACINQLAVQLNKEKNIHQTDSFIHNMVHKKYEKLIMVGSILTATNRDIQNCLENNNITQELFEKYYTEALRPLLAEENRKILSKNRTLILEIFNKITLPWSLFVGAIKGIISHRWQTFDAGFFATRSAKSLVEATAVITHLKPKFERK